MSPGKDQDYLCEGMAEEVMNALVRVVGIRVASRTSAFRASQNEQDLAAIGRALCVDQVLEGSVRTAGSRLRVMAQLSDVASGYQLWSERYDREAADVFAVQDEIARGVVDAVKARLSSGEHAVPARPPVRDLEAYRFYLQGRFLRHTKNDHAGALRAYEEAVRLDPTHALSRVGIAEATVLASFYSLVPAREACARAREELEAARRLQGESPEGLAAEGFMAFVERRWADSEAAFKRAIELQPRFVQALAPLGMILGTRGRIDEALRLLERAREADPLSAFPWGATGTALLAARRPAEADRYIEDALSFEKENTLALSAACLARAALGRHAEAVAAGDQLVALTRRSPFFVGLLGWALATAGRTAEARALLDELRSRPPGAPTVVPEVGLLAALGETEAAFEALARAEDERQPYLSFTGYPSFDLLRDDPRFGALVGRLGQPPA